MGRRFSSGLVELMSGLYKNGKSPVTRLTTFSSMFSFRIFDNFYLGFNTLASCREVE